jgi:serine/threonine protein kinase
LRIDSGVRIGPYVIERRLGQNRASPIYLGRDESGGRAAIRLIQPEVATSAVRARLKREARALSTVDHPGVVRVCGAGEHEGAPWIAMNYVRGTGLERLLVERGPLAIDVALRHALQAAEALVAAHDVGVVHRDIRPSNLILTADGRLVLVDFGLAPWSEVDDFTGGRDPIAGVSGYAAP